jgi:hypothetical protein
VDPEAEVSIEAKGKTYTLYYGNRAFRVAEIELGKPWTEINTTSRQDITIAIWAGLKQHHPQLTVDDIDEIIDEAGYGNVVGIAIKALNKAAGAPEGTASGNGRRGRKVPAPVGVAE